jgi:hypothetical protein
MASEVRQIRCSTHGLQEETLVCHHIIESMHTGVPVGFYWPAESNQRRPDAWCTACEQARVAAGGEWTDEVMKVVNAKVLCGACYDYAKSIWERGRKVTQ